jgi:acyl-CoA reductase-like NAD-dependent aldehyde dehydrogenase
MLLAKLSNFLKLNISKFISLETCKGKPFQQARQDVQEAVKTLNYFNNLDKKVYPLGTVGLITAYNYPLLLLIWKLAPALKAKNKIIIKPAQQTPESALVIQEYIESISPGLVTVIQGGPQQAIVATRALIIGYD